MNTIYDDTELLDQYWRLYGLTIVDGCRCYEYTKSLVLYDMGGSSPYCIQVYSEKIFSGSWSKILIGLLTYLDSLVFKSNDELLKIKSSVYNRREIFSTTIRKGDKSFSEFRPGLYFHNAVDSNFAIEIIYSLLEAYEIDLDDVFIYIRLSQKSEPHDVTNYVIEKNKAFFRESLLSLKISGVDEESIDDIIDFVDYLSTKFLASSYRDFDQNLFLFDNHDDFAHCKDNLLNDLERKSIIDFIDIDWGDNIKPNEPTPEELEEREEKKERARHDFDYGQKVLEYLDYYYMMLDDLSSLDY